jgi:hypothetical protein
MLHVRDGHRSSQSSRARNGRSRHHYNDLGSEQALAPVREHRNYFKRLYLHDKHPYSALFVAPSRRACSEPNNDWAANVCDSALSEAEISSVPV